MKYFDIVADFTPFTAIGWLAEQVVLALDDSGFCVKPAGKITNGQWNSNVSDSLMKLACGFRDSSRRDNVRAIWVGPMSRVCEIKPGDIVITGWESNKVPKVYVDHLSRAKAVLTWGDWGADVLRNSGLKRPCHGFSLGVDTNYFRPAAGNKPQRTTFLTAGRTAHGYARKGVDLVMLAFLYAFPSDREEVVLQIKVQPDCPLTQLRSGRIQVLTEWLAPQHLADWYRQGSAFVSASCGEGWGLHAHEALACGTPIISPYFGGITEFFEPDVNGWKVPHTLVKATALHQDAGKWAQVDFYKLAAAMRYVHENPAEALVFGAVGALRVAHLNVAAMRKQLVALIRRYEQ